MLQREIEAQPGSSRQYVSESESENKPLQQLHLSNDRFLLHVVKRLGKVIHRLIDERSSRQRAVTRRRTRIRCGRESFSVGSSLLNG